MERVVAVSYCQCTALITLLLCRDIFHQEASIQTLKRSFSSDNGEILTRLSIFCHLKYLYNSSLSRVHERRVMVIVRILTYTKEEYFHNIMVMMIEYCTSVFLKFSYCITDLL